MRFSPWYGWAAFAVLVERPRGAGWSAAVRGNGLAAPGAGRTGFVLEPRPLILRELAGPRDLGVFGSAAERSVLSSEQLKEVLYLVWRPGGLVIGRSSGRAALSRWAI